ncbi:alpha/beta hydrolase family protein [Lachnoanaerobaculum sp. MSX33]|uniref:alpha/beta hydrolase n=1 Tax=Lachnoanaerobaculum sp. MSX33 TaxID=936596 RepID=UPI0003DF86DC|nr:alpha/beta hydrolase [Lachnoanaerobaculum sp. MSX33]ETO95432.1 alpha/beta hydrolase family protein [Lachnoanaerobaculum sp. MSX33]
MKKIIIAIAIIIVLVAIGWYCRFILGLASQIAAPNVSTLDKEISWEKEHGLWGNYDSYEKEEYTVKGYKDYELHVTLVKNPVETDKYVIISHGFKSNRYGAVKYVDTYMDLGFNCIIYDLRDHGENEKTALSLGQFESEDLEKLIEDSYSRYGNIKLGLHGESMGAATSLTVLAKKPKVDFVVADCGFSNLYDLIYKAYDLAKTPFVLPSVNTAMKLRYGYDMKKTSPKDALVGNEVPICFIHGEADTFILPENSQVNKAATAGYSELHLVPDAAHARSREVLGEAEYRGIIGDFLNNIDFK